MLARIETAQKEGLKITADMYTYTAAGTGLDACFPPWTEDGGYPALFKRLRDPATREKIEAEVKIDSDKWENLYLAAGSPDKILLVGFKSEKLKPLTGKTLAEVAKMRGKDPIDTDDGFSRRRRIAHQHDLLFDVGREREEGNIEAMDLVRLR